MLVSYPLPMTPLLTWNLFVLGDKCRLLLKVETMAKLEKLKPLYWLRSPLLQSKPRCWSGSQRLFVLEGHEKAGALVQPWMVVSSGQQGREVCMCFGDILHERQLAEQQRRALWNLQSASWRWWRNPIKVARPRKQEWLFEWKCIEQE